MQYTFVEKDIDLGLYGVQGGWGRETRTREWTTREWTTRQDVTRVENAGVANAAPSDMGRNRRSGQHGTR